MSGGATPDYWRTVLIHEAGHAVAALALNNEVADIIVKETATEHRPYSAAYSSPREVTFVDGTVDPVSEVIIHAAGAKAEEVCLAISRSSGFANDLAKIRQVKRTWGNKCDEAFWRSLPHSPTQLDEDLARIPVYRQKLEEIVDEICSGFTRTAAVISANRQVLEAIAAEAHGNLLSIGENRLSNSLILLAGARIRVIWDTSPGQRVV